MPIPIPQLCTTLLLSQPYESLSYPALIHAPSSLAISYFHTSCSFWHSSHRLYLSAWNLKYHVEYKTWQKIKYIVAKIIIIFLVRTGRMKFFSGGSSAWYSSIHFSSSVTRSLLKAVFSEKFHLTLQPSVNEKGKRLKFWMQYTLSLVERQTLYTRHAHQHIEVYMGREMKLEETV